MEPQTRFDLNQAIAQWRSELLARPGLAAADVKDLESHLNDQISDYVRKGLGDEDAFWLAKRRLGSADDLGGEFRCANPQRAWSERMLWVVFGIAAYSAWTAISSFVVNAAFLWSAHSAPRYENNWPGAIASLGLTVAFVCIVFGASRVRLFSGWKDERLQRISTWVVGLWLGLQATLVFIVYRDFIVRPEFSGVTGPLIFRHVAHLLVPAAFFGWLLMEIRRSAMAEKARA